MVTSSLFMTCFFPSPCIFIECILAVQLEHRKHTDVTMWLTVYACGLFIHSYNTNMRFTRGIKLSATISPTLPRAWLVIDS